MKPTGVIKVVSGAVVVLQFGPTIIAYYSRGAREMLTKLLGEIRGRQDDRGNRGILGDTVSLKNLYQN